MRLRGFHGRRLSPRRLRVLAWLGGSILVRSYERSEWVYKAMLTRGYGQATLPRDEFQASPADFIALAATLVVTAGFISAEVLI